MIAAMIGMLGDEDSDMQCVALMSLVDLAKYGKSVHLVMTSTY